MMELMAIIKNEYRKILAKKKSIVLYILTGIIVLGSLIIYYTLSESLKLTVISSVYYPIWVLKWMMGFILPLFLAMTVIDTITGEFQDESIKNVLQLPVERYQIYLAKLIANLCYAAGLIITILLVSFIGTIFISGSRAFSALSETLFSYAMAFLALGLLIIIISLFALFFKSTSTALTMSILLAIALNAVGLYYSSLQPYLPTSYLSIYSKMLNGNMLLYLFSYYIIFTILGIFKFQAKEV